MRIGVDLMGSDSPPNTLFSAVLSVLQNSPFSFTLFAPSSILDSLTPHEQLEFHAAPDVITMEDDPLTAVRSKQKSSLAEGIRLLSEKKIDAFVSAGNTGALIAAATLSLPLFPSISRPALLATLPKREGDLAVIDVGGHVQTKAEHLVQYAYLGASFQRSVSGIERPKVGLLNIGSESKKGTAEVREAHKILAEKKSSLFEFVGNIEGQEVLKSSLDVLVTDGFTGNVFLKTAEGVSSFVCETLMEVLDSTQVTRLQELKKYFHPSDYPGALVCGVEGLVIKCHGGASEKGIANSIRGAFRLLQNNINTKIQEDLWELK